ncbi:MAG: alpha/beta fold hydrolase [Hyphomicrobiales bacterium]|nr:alpha/beta fold hydrolase [Hyphomicrobiales bacterium]
MADAAIEHGHVAVNGINLHVARAGQDGAPLVLFLHGFPEFWYAWRRQLGLFGADRLAVAPDLRGFNLSDKPADPRAYRAPVVVEDIRQLAARFTDGKFVLVAHDWGGAAAWAFALAHPEMLARLVILNSPHPLTFLRELHTNPAQIKASQYFRLFRDPAAEATLAADNFAWLWRFSLAGLHARGVLTDADRDAYLAAWAQPGALTGGLNWYRASPAPVPEEGAEPGRLPAVDPARFTVRVPTTVIWGLRDFALMSGLLDGLGDLVPDLTLHRVEDAGHWIAYEKPDLVDRLIGDALAAA